MREVTLYQFRHFDPLRGKWIKSQHKLSEPEIQHRYPDGYEILRDTAETIRLRQQDEFSLIESNAIFLNENKAGTEAPETLPIKR